MGQISSKYDIDEELELGGKTLPNDFANSNDCISFKKALILSAILHPTLVGVVWLIAFIFALLGINFITLEKPPIQPRDIEFVLVNNTQPPVDRNTKNRAETDSRAGGIHDPSRKVSAPSPSPSPKRVSSPSPSKQKTVKKQNSPSPLQKMLKLKSSAVPKAPAKPTPMSAPKPTAPRVARPSSNIPRAQVPKLSQKPKSPFSIEVPKSNQPVGKALSYGNGSSASGGGTTSSGSGSRGVGMPSPQFSASKGTGSGSRGSSGSSGSGNYGNPSPGNPAGAPGVDAIRQPNWGPYMRELERRIKRNWNPPKGDSSKRVVVYFKIARDGKLLAIRVSKTSGTALADQAAKAAIELTAPFSPLPPEYKGSSIDIDFTFDYNVLGANYR